MISLTRSRTINSWKYSHKENQKPSATSLDNGASQWPSSGYSPKASINDSQLAIKTAPSLFRGSWTAPMACVCAPPRVHNGTRSAGLTTLCRCQITLSTKEMPAIVALAYMHTLRRLLKWGCVEQNLWRTLLWLAKYSLS